MLESYIVTNVAYCDINKFLFKMAQADFTEVWRFHFN